MIDFPKLDTCTIFPLPEGTNIEFKLGFNSSMTDKIIATICGILNSGGGYLVIGIEDTSRRIIGITPNKSMDLFLLMLDSIYHQARIKKVDGSTIPITAIKSGIVQAADDKEVLVVTITAEDNSKYMLKDGAIWHRLAASNYRQTALYTVYTKNELDIIIADKIAKNTSNLTQQFEIEKKHMQYRFQSEKDKMQSKFKGIADDFEKIMGAAKDAEKNLNEFREMLFTNIEAQKMCAEKELSQKNKSWFSFLCCI